MTAEEAFAYCEEVFPAIRGKFELLDLRPMGATVRMKVDARDVRPGGTISGPSMFGLADVGFYLACFGALGREALAVTTNASINFMRKPAEADMIAEVRLLKVGRALVVGDVIMRSDGDERPVAHATMTYSIPPRRGI